MIQIIEEDLVDWDPLVMRFRGQKKIARAEAKRIVKFILNWFDQSASTDLTNWSHAKEWNAEVTDGNVVEATCHLMPAEAVASLAAAVEREFPTICEIRLGHPINEPSDPLSFDWTSLENSRREVDGDECEIAAFTISFSPVTVAQFEQFMRATSYKPIPDLAEYDGFLIENVRGTFGASPKIPIFGVTYDDASAYCEWAQLRLPSEHQLAHFFEDSVRRHRKSNWAFPCWTSTSTAPDQFVARDGPYVAAASDWPIERRRLVLHRHHYGWPLPACFRVVEA